MSLTIDQLQNQQIVIRSAEQPVNIQIKGNGSGGGDIEVDDTLTISGAAADAAVVGGALSDINDALLVVNEELNTKVRYDIAQSLTNTQKATARSNIDAADTTTVSNLQTQVNNIDTCIPIYWNQLIKNPNFNGTTDWAPQGCTVSAFGNILTLTTASGGGSGMKRILSNNIPFVSGHKYLVRYDVGFRGNANGDASCQYRTYSGSSGATLPIHADTIPLTADSFTHISYVTTASVTANSGITTGTASTKGSDVFKIKNFCVFDLTVMFGAGNEPTAEKFETLFSNAVYGYNSGESGFLVKHNGNYIYTAPKYIDDTIISDKYSWSGNKVSSELNNKQTKPIITNTSISSNAWNNNTVTLSVSGVTTDSLVQVNPNSYEDSVKIAQNGIFNTAQSTNLLTFTCQSTPTTTINFKIVVWN